MKLSADPESNAAKRILIAAKYAKLEVELSAGDKLQWRVQEVLETAKGRIFSGTAIARYFSRMSGLYGQDLDEGGLIDSWIEFCTQKLEVPLLTLVGRGCGAGEAKEDVKHALAVLDDHLSHQRRMVGETVTLADIFLATALADGLPLLKSENLCESFGNVMLWLHFCVAQPEFESVLGNATSSGKSTGEKSAAKQGAPAPSAAKGAPVPETMALDDMLKAWGMREWRVPGDCHCQCRAVLASKSHVGGLSSGVIGIPTLPSDDAVRQLRLDVATHLEADSLANSTRIDTEHDDEDSPWPHRQPLKEGNIPEYLSGIRSKGWGDGCTLVALAEVLRVVIVVVNRHEATVAKHPRKAKLLSWLADAAQPCSPLASHEPLIAYHLIADDLMAMIQRLQLPVLWLCYAAEHYNALVPTEGGSFNEAFPAAQPPVSLNGPSVQPRSGDAGEQPEAAVLARFGPPPLGCAPRPPASCVETASCKEKRIKTIRKKLLQIERLRESGRALNAEERLKVDSEPKLVKDLAELLEDPLEGPARAEGKPKIEQQSAPQQGGDVAAHSVQSSLRIGEDQSKPREAHEPHLVAGRPVLAVKNTFLHLASAPSAKRRAQSEPGAWRRIQDESEGQAILRLLQRAELLKGRVKEPKAASEVSLPEGWRKVAGKAGKRDYYWHPGAKHTQWDRPLSPLLPPESGWQYIDSAQRAQGPFSLADMLDWFKRGYFKLDLLMRCDPNDPFVPLGKLYPLPFVPFQSHPIRPKSQNNAFHQMPACAAGP